MTLNDSILMIEFQNLSQYYMFIKRKKINLVQNLTFFVNKNPQFKISYIQRKNSLVLIFVNVISSSIDTITSKRVVLLNLFLAQFYRVQKERSNSFTSRTSEN